MNQAITGITTSVERSAFRAASVCEGGGGFSGPGPAGRGGSGNQAWAAHTQGRATIAPVTSAGVMARAASIDSEPTAGTMVIPSKAKLPSSGEPPRAWK